MTEEWLHAVVRRLRELEGIDWQLEEARRMKGNPIAHWEAMGYQVVCRYGTRYRSELLGVIGTVQRREEAGEDVKLLLSEDQKHCILMARDVRD